MGAALKPPPLPQTRANLKGGHGSMNKVALNRCMSATGKGLTSWPGGFLGLTDWICVVSQIMLEVKDERKEPRMVTCRGEADFRTG